MDNSDNKVLIQYSDIEYQILWKDFEGLKTTLTYICYDIQKKEKSDQIQLKTENGENLNLEDLQSKQSVQLQYKALEKTSIQYIYSIEGSQVKVQKFKGTRKLENIVYELSTLKNQNQQQYQLYQQKKQQQEDQDQLSPQFGQPQNQAGNDGKSQAQFLKKENQVNLNKPRGITQQELQQHCKEGDVWMALNGKVYDVTNYVKFHPGGKARIMEGAGQDGTILFNQYHPWVNGHFLLQKYQVGYLVRNKLI